MHLSDYTTIHGDRESNLSALEEQPNTDNTLETEPNLDPGTSCHITWRKAKIDNRFLQPSPRWHHARGIPDIEPIIGLETLGHNKGGTIYKSEM